MKILEILLHKGDTAIGILVLGVMASTALFIMINDLISLIIN